MCNALLELMKDELDEKREEGIREGESLGVNRINQLILKLSELNRTDDILKAAADREYQKKLLKEFGLLKTLASTVLVYTIVFLMSQLTSEQ